jgi:hypothetical protein
VSAVLRRGDRGEAGVQSRVPRRGLDLTEPDDNRIASDTLSTRFKTLERRAGVHHRGLQAAHDTHAALALAAGARLDVISRQ